MATKSYQLSAESQQFIANEIKAGRYQDERVVLQAGLSLLEEQSRRQRMKDTLRRERHVET